MGPCLPVTQKNCLPPRGISVLEKLIKTCPVWLQLGLDRAEVARILHQEAAGVSRGLSISWSTGQVQPPGAARLGSRGLVGGLFSALGSSWPHGRAGGIRQVWALWALGHPRQA